MAGKIGAVMQSLFGKQPAGVVSATVKQTQTDPNAGAAGTGTVVPANSSTMLEGGITESGVTGVKKTPENPLDQFSDIWQPPTGKDGKPVTKPDNKLFNVEPAKFFEHASKQDFRKFVKPETLARIVKGGDDAQVALSEVVQDLGSNIFATSALASSKMIERAMETQRTQFEASLPGLFKKLNLGENLSNKNPALKHPAAQPIVEALKSTLAQRFPDATAADLQETAENFLTTFATEVAGKKETPEPKGGKKGAVEDWSDFLPEGYQ